MLEQFFILMTLHTVTETRTTLRIPEIRPTVLENRELRSLTFCPMFRMFQTDNNICEYEMSCNTEIRVHRKINVEMIYLIQRSIHALNTCLYMENDFFATSTFYDKNFIFPSLYKPMRDLFDLGERARGRER